MFARLLIGLSCLSSAAISPAAEPVRRPNVVAILSDDQGWGKFAG